MQQTNSKERKFTQQVTVSPDVLFQEVDGETVLLDIQGECYFGLDKVGTRIWNLLQDNGDLQFAFETILAEYKVEPDQLKSDLTKLLNDLEEEGLITIQGNTPN